MFCITITFSSHRANGGTVSKQKTHQVSRLVSSAYFCFVLIRITKTLFFLIKDMSEELTALRDLARKFSREEILPVAAELDRTGEVC